MQILGRKVPTPAEFQYTGAMPGKSPKFEREIPISTVRGRLILGVEIDGWALNSYCLYAKYIPRFYGNTSGVKRKMDISQLHVHGVIYSCLNVHVHV
jgi:hypothetical protein